MMHLEPIAYVRSPFVQKFGVPRQSGVVDDVTGYIDFVSQYRHPAALVGLDGFSYLWLIWGFSLNKANDPGSGHRKWLPSIRPPVLRGEKMGVFATRSPNRPNPIGLSSVKILAVDAHAKTNQITVGGLDLVDGTPIYDIKPYVPQDVHLDAKYSYLTEHPWENLQVADELGFLDVTGAHKEAIKKLLAQDPRPRYQDDPSRLYGFAYKNWNVKFQVEADQVKIVAVEIL